MFVVRTVQLYQYNTRKLTFWYFLQDVNCINTNLYSRYNTFINSLDSKFKISHMKKCYSRKTVEPNGQGCTVCIEGIRGLSLLTPTKTQTTLLYTINL